MNSSKDNIMRYLTSSALLQGGFFRRQWISFLNEKHRAIAPNLGINLPLQIKICKYFENRQTKYDVTFSCISLIFILSYLLLFQELQNIGEPFIPLTVFFLIIAFLVRTYKGEVEHKWLLKYFKEDKYEPGVVSNKFDATVDEKVLAKFNQNDQNLIIYKGLAPFIGAGINIGGWSFSVDLSKPKDILGQKTEVISFSLEDLYEKIDHSFNDLKFEGLKIQDILFVNGSDIRDKKWILTDIYDLPITKVDQERLKQFIESNDLCVRHYKWIQAFDWGDGLVVSYFLRCSKRGKSMFVEVSVFLLTPLKDGYRNIDKIIPRDLKQLIITLIGYFLITPFSIIYSWFALLGKIISGLEKIFRTKERYICKQIKNNLRFNYGAYESIRTSISSSQYTHYFQRLDQEMYVKIIQQELLDNIVSFLDEHNINTADFKEKQTTIINSGIIVHGGDVRAQTMAVGMGAQAKKSDIIKERLF